MKEKEKRKKADSICQSDQKNQAVDVCPLITQAHTLSNWTLKFNGKEEEEEGASRFDGNKFRTRNADKKNSKTAKEHIIFQTK